MSSYYILNSRSQKVPPANKPPLEYVAIKTPSYLHFH